MSAALDAMKRVLDQHDLDQTSAENRRRFARQVGWSMLVRLVMATEHGATPAQVAETMNDPWPPQDPARVLWMMENLRSVGLLSVERTLTGPVYTARHVPGIRTVPVGARHVIVAPAVSVVPAPMPGYPHAYALQVVCPYCTLRETHTAVCDQQLPAVLNRDWCAGMAVARCPRPEGTVEGPLDFLMVAPTGIRVSGAQP